MKLKKEYHGTSGPLQLSLPPYVDNVALPWIETVKSLGIRTNFDANDGDNTGVWISVHSCDSKSIRSSVASAYYEPNQSRSNLKVITGALVTKVLTSGEGEVVAYGVEYLKDGVLETLCATKEVILCCGSYKTPQILELSGIGDPEVLNKFGIKIVINLPGVGNNLRDVYAFTTTLHFADISRRELIPGHETWARMSDLKFAEQQEEIFKATGGGMLNSIPSAFAALPLRDFDEDGSIARLINKERATAISEIQNQWALNARVPFLQITGFDRFLPGTLNEPKADTDYMTTTMILLHPFSRGSAHIISKDPNAAPEIDHNYLNSPVDIKILVEAYKTVRKIYNTAPLKYHIMHEVNPGIQVQTDEEISEYIKKTLDSTYHPIGTSSMLPQEDKGVVDSRLRVYGTKNLRVVNIFFA
ncbi:hypothetical protein C0993_012638 [Termitomyces sp. T159_Od127]|nr:hypothetical protein C0993_012638 [Termitomyces sp. T159_Od127]